MFAEKRSQRKHLLPVILLSLAVAALAVFAALQFASLSTTRTTLAATEDSLVAAKTDLSRTGADLQTATTNLNQSQLELTATKASLAQTQTDLAAANADLTNARTTISATEADLSAAKTQYERVTTGYGYALNDPTYQQMESFLATDPTKNHTYNEATYNCFNYSADTIADAIKQHVRCGFVYIEFPTSAHAIIVFDTTDRGMIYIEPQSDEQVDLQTGKHYYRSIETAPGYYYPQPSYDDTVVDFTVIW